jgi:hypothetical protein
MLSACSRSTTKLPIEPVNQSKQALGAGLSAPPALAVGDHEKRLPKGSRFKESNEIASGSA